MGFYEDHTMGPSSVLILGGSGYLEISIPISQVEAD